MILNDTTGLDTHVFRNPGCSLGCSLPQTSNANSRSWIYIYTKRAASHHLPVGSHPELMQKDHVDLGCWLLLTWRQKDSKWGSRKVEAWFICIVNHLPVALDALTSEGSGRENTAAYYISLPRSSGWALHYNHRGQWPIIKDYSGPKLQSTPTPAK